MALRRGIFVSAVCGRLLWDSTLRMGRPDRQHGMKPWNEVDSRTERQFFFFAARFFWQ